ncbi:hypothetical protein A3J17_04810 [Candidatus Curtissbacteria bacterium RIFCSPLOWO2_02_FULL_40_11]|uniref:HAD family hydrolase n=2 Tax=Candidatus Curtissiibacteriota TaxID=1752717 RepID=A0A1F5GC23_9BACT|nr:MAG: hypothetical protein A3D04_03975 [Candidatus Curtissbacteria bacterium RIFCSPHIGHO2_02_FULL_40_16b]OGE01413.1 MAG: hypothetical protein A3J17_04810 [Candidatus Curtissbacteria bacterium RIFCSPLOWO2_02_FULL_40_11]OGE12822.1 MAG: hypothetical protein A3G14_01550 [Candidatus Curtissbacteria bacterium RIFCSPLOWO2_12_FULL_38_9]
MIKAVIFDLEGVIVDSERHWDKSDTKFLKNHGIKYDSKRIKPLLMGKNLHEGVKILQGIYDLRGEVEDLVQERRDIIINLYPTTNFIPGFKCFFNKVKKLYSTGVATSIERRFLEIIDNKLGISNLFNNHVYSIADIGFTSKPNPDIFLFVADKIKTKPEECLILEDSPNGIEAAKRAGMKCIALTTSTDRKRLKGADFIVDSYSQIELNRFL